MLSNKDKKFLEKIINKFSKSDNLSKNTNYPLLEKGFTNEDICSGAEVLFSKKITMSSITKKFEKAFAKYVGSKYALMVNSGSSANLLSSFALLNPKKKNRMTSEAEALYKMEKSIVAKKLIKKGSIIKYKDLAFKSPGGGLEPFNYRKVVNKMARRDINEDELVLFRNLK